MIVTLTLNPALLVTYEIERTIPTQSNPVSRVRYRAGGRGLAVARVLQLFGHEVVAAGLAGGAAGELVRAELARAGVAAQFTRIAMESRRVVEVAEAATGTVTTFAEPAPYITTEELGRLAADYRALLTDATAAVLSGDLPAGLPPETYGSLASYAAEAGVPVVLDAGGSALRHGAARGPALVIPEDAADCPPADLLAAGAGAVAVPAGRADGSLPVPAADTAIRVLTPACDWQAVLGAGDALSSGEPGAVRDALVAGLVPGVALGWSWPDMLRHAVALAAAAGPGGQVDLAAYESLLPKVQIVSSARAGR